MNHFLYNVFMEVILCLLLPIPTSCVVVAKIVVVEVVAAVADNVSMFKLISLLVLLLILL